MSPLIADLDRFVRTRTAWHSIAEHVVSPARYHTVGKIGLRAVAGGFGTPHFGDDRRVLIVGDEIVREQYGASAVAPITTLRAAAEFVGIEPGAPTEVFMPTTPFELDRLLEIDPEDATRLAGWYALGAAVLGTWRELHRDGAPSLVQLWPEHFDLACDLGDADGGARANYGFSPGDDAIPEPYAYVGPWDIARHPSPAWDQSWGASLRNSQLGADAAGQIVEFFSVSEDAIRV